MGNFTSRPRRPSQAANTFSNVIATGVPVATAVATPTNIAPAATAAAAAVPPPDANTAAQLALSVCSDKVALASDEEHTLTVMLSIKAPAAPDDVSRPPLDLVACIDRSGSMRGEKMNLMKKTLELLVKRAGLKSGDRISLVTFDSAVKLELGLTSMDADGVVKAEGVVKQLHPGATTNLSGGLLKAIEVLDRSEAPSKEGRTRAVMCFTDGLANEGIRDPNQLQQAVAGALSAASAKLGGPINLYTFGFGADHNETCLRNLATGSGAAGMYYYVSTAEDIPNAFADCLGGLTSVVAQNTTLSLEPARGVTVARVLGSTYSRDAEGAVTLGDLFAEDEKDVLIELKLPKLSAPAREAAQVLVSTLRGFNVVRAAPDVVEARLRVERPAVTPPEQPANLKLDAQRNRIHMAEQMEAATRLADEGDLAGGRERLAACRRYVAGSASAMGGDVLSANLLSQCAELEETYQTTARYRSVGSKMSKMQARSHMVQRGTHMNVDSYVSGAKRKAALKSSWMSSIASGSVESDSD